MSKRMPSNLDGVLRAFFRKEMPEPWPTMAVPPLPHQHQPSNNGGHAWVFSRHGALAAAVALFLGSYFLIAGLFPTPKRPTSGPEGQFFIGQKIKLPPRPETTEGAKPTLAPLFPDAKKGAFPGKGTPR